MKNQFLRRRISATFLGCALVSGCATLPGGVAGTGDELEPGKVGREQTVSPARTAQPTVIRGQQPYDGTELWNDFQPAPPSDNRPRQPVPISGSNFSPPANENPQTFGDSLATGDDTTPLPPPNRSYAEGWSSGLEGGFGDPFAQPPEYPDTLSPEFPPPRPADVIVSGQEAQTGRFMFGAGINSDAGFTFQVVLDEQNFDWRKPPRTLDDIIDGRAFRGGGQRLRLEAMPGNVVERYLFNFTDPYWQDTPLNLNVSGFLFDRRYFDWDERRLGGRIGLGYRLTPDVSLSVGVRGENVEIHRPRVRGVDELEEVLGHSDLFGGRVTLTHDTRDRPFNATEGHYLELSYEQVFGDFDFPRGTVDYRRYFLLHERPDQSGRHTLGSSVQLGITGSDTPVFENFFAGGYSTLRGFRFREASPRVNNVTVGGELSLLGSLEYMFPISADDMIKGVVFSDYGTVEEELNIEWDDFRVAVGFGLRFSIPAMGPAPIAVDLAIPLNREGTDRIQNFSFFVGAGR